MSWWPKPEYWDKSPYSVGYWSDAAENWFLARLSKIRSDEMIVFGAKKWKDVLRNAVVAAKLRTAVDNASEQFLIQDYRMPTS